MLLPSLKYEYNNARIVGLTIGPRREILLELCLLSWADTAGRCDTKVHVRFGGIKNFEEVKAFLKVGHHETSELAYLRYSTNQPSKPGQLSIDISFERVDAVICIECADVRVEDAAQNTDMS
ncbi:MAG: hypothetical protein QM811_05285 [Pirellulales bacterium]